MITEQQKLETYILRQFWKLSYKYTWLCNFIHEEKSIITTIKDLDYNSKVGFHNIREIGKLIFIINEHSFEVIL